MAVPEEYVLFEQLDYLLDHTLDCGRPQCPDCDRLKRAAKVLLEPFQEPPRKPGASPVVPGAAERYAEAVKRWHEAIAKQGLQPR